MLKRIALYVSALLMLSLLSACDIDLKVQTYMWDLLDTARQSETYMAPATIAIETGGEDSKSEIKKFVSRAFRNADNFRTERKDISEYLLADIKVPITKDFDGDWSEHGDDLIVITIRSLDDETGGLTLGMSLNKDKMQEIKDYVKSNYMQDIGLENVALSLEVNNDTRSTVSIHPQSVYAGGDPVPFRSEYELERRDTLRMQLSNVLRDSLNHKDNVYFLKVNPND